MRMRLRDATTDDLSLLQYWDTKPHVIKAVGRRDEGEWKVELSQQPGWRSWLVADLDTSEGCRPIGIVQIIDPELEETHYWGGIGPGHRAIDIWIGEESDLGRGYGSEMMRLALGRCFEAPEVVAVLLDPLVSNTGAHRFYERLGFERMDTRYFDDDLCHVYRLNRSRWSTNA